MSDWGLFISGPWDGRRDSRYGAECRLLSIYVQLPRPLPRVMPFQPDVGRYPDLDPPPFRYRRLRFNGSLMVWAAETLTDHEALDRLLTHYNPEVEPYTPEAGVMPRLPALRWRIYDPAKATAYPA